LSTEDATEPERLPPRLRRAIELIYQVEGVTGAQIWHWADRIAVGVSLTATSTPSEVFGRVESAIAPLREIEETWEFGLLVDR
jgi:type IV secretory pathway protease TraF